MLFRFSLYGFLKNQRYFEPFLLLAFMEKGVSFAMFGSLIGFREICIAVMEVPTGAIADVVGRRRSMILSFLAYIVSFLIFGLTGQVWLLFVAMFVFAIGEAFRTGTHKAIIFDWLARQGRQDQKVRVYGFTRSWSKMGSAINVLLAAALVYYVRGCYEWVFLACIVPYLLNIINFLTYPSYLDGPRGGGGSLSDVLRAMVHGLRESVRIKPLRRLFAESMAFDGVFKAGKDYLQAVLQLAALAIPYFLWMADKQRTAVLVAVVYFMLHLLEGAASRHSHALSNRAGSEQRGAKWLWMMNLAAYVAMTGGIYFCWMPLTIGAFVALAIIQNFWRPILISRFVAHADPDTTATLLSIESQGKTLAAAAIAPLLGLAVDYMPDDIRFLPLGMLGLTIAAAMLITAPKQAPPARQAIGD